MSENQGVRHYKARFIGGPLDWTWTHRTATALYDYKRVASGHFEDSDYVLIRSTPKSAEELKADQQ